MSCDLITSSATKGNSVGTYMTDRNTNIQSVVITAALLLV